MAIVSAHKSDAGLNKNKQINEDYVWVDEFAKLYIVADGMGGQEAGDVASRLTAVTVGDFVVEFLSKYLKEQLSAADAKNLLVEAIETANEVVYKAAKTAHQKKKMGATIIAALVQENSAYISHAGDSRAYLYRDNVLTRLTEDNSWAAEFGGSKEPSHLMRNGIDNFLTKSVGQESKVDPSFLEINLTPGDCLLLCSDGLWSMIDETVIHTELQKITDNPALSVAALVKAANAAGGKDNISAIIIKML